MATDIVPFHCPAGPYPLTWDLVKDGRFIIGGLTQDLVRAHQEQLEANNWRYVEFYGGGQSPHDLVELVRRNRWQARQWNLKGGSDGRYFFSGFIEQPAIRFEFLILDRSMVERLREQLRWPPAVGQSGPAPAPAVGPGPATAPGPASAACRSPSADTGSAQPPLAGKPKKPPPGPQQLGLF